LNAALRFLIAYVCLAFGGSQQRNRERGEEEGKRERERMRREGGMELERGRVRKRRQGGKRREREKGK